MNDSPTLLVVAHGTQSVAGAATIRQLIELVRAARPRLRVLVCYLDVQQPALPEALAAVHGAIVIVPALLSSGYHVRTDIPGIVGTRPDAVITAHLGPDPLLSVALGDRLTDAGGDGPVALIAAGSSDPAAEVDVAAAAMDLSRLLSVPVRPMSVSDAGPGACALAGLRVASYVLAEGAFADAIAERAQASGASAVSAPIGAHPAAVQLILDRYDEGLAALGRAPGSGGSGMLGR